MDGENTEDLKGRHPNFEAFGMIAALAIASTYHRNWCVRDIEHNIVPAIAAGQCRIYFADRGRPLAFVTWAFADEEAHGELVRYGRTPAAGKWSAGEHLWFIDICAPFGGVRRIVRDLQQNHFPHRPIAHSIRRNPDGTVRRFNVWRNPFRTDSPPPSA